MSNNLYIRITFSALTIAVVLIMFFYDSDRIAEWKVVVCSVSAALLSASQTAFDFYDRFRRIVIKRRTKTKPTKVLLRGFKTLGIITHICGIVVFIVGLAVDLSPFPIKEANLITLASFAIIFFSLTMKSFDEDGNASLKIVEFIEGLE